MQLNNDELIVSEESVKAGLLPVSVKFWHEPGSRHKERGEP